MTTRPRIEEAGTRRYVVLLGAIAFLAAACGGSSGSSSDVGAVAADTPSDPSSSATSSPETEAQTQENDTPTPVNGATSDGTPMASSSPIGAFFDGGFEDALAEYRIRVQETILVCMAAQGFEFAVDGNGRVNQVAQQQNELTTREWTAQYGFGISTSFDSIANNQTSNPNTAIFVSMSPSEREIWSQTLSGGDIGAAAAGDFTSRPLEEQGCVGQALIETGGQEAIEGLSTFGDIREEGEAALLDTREMIEVTDAWARCMSETGFASYANLDDPENEIEERLAAVTAPMSAAIENLSDEEGAALIAGESLDLENLPDLDVQALRDLQDHERALGVADLDCYEAEVQAVYEPLLADFENGLLTEYATEFDALKNIGS